MMCSHRIAVHAASLSLLIAAAAAGPLSAAEPRLELAQARQVSAAVPEAAEFINRLADRAIADLSDKTMAVDMRLQHFRRLLADGFDVPQIGRFVLGRYWRLANDDERREYLRLFEEYIVQTYAARFGDYAGENLKVGTAISEPDGAVTVNSQIIRPSGPPVKVEWKLRREAPSFKIVDVMVEGVSMSITQRDDFSATIQAKGGKVENLLAILRERVKTTQVDAKNN